VGGVNKRVSIKDITSPALGVALSTPEWRMYTNACSYSIIHTQPSHSTHTQRFVQVYSLLSKTTPRGPTAYGAYRGTSLTRNPSMYSAPGRIAGRHREQYTIFFHHSSNGLLAVDRGQHHLDIAKSAVPHGPPSSGNELWETHGQARPGGRWCLEGEITL
jgi:hypothetical protein